MKFQHSYSDGVRDSDVECKDPSLAQQQFKDEVDINVMLEKFKVTGQMPEGVRLPQYGDFRGVSDYREAMEAVRKADIAFMELPAHVRARFKNDPQELLEFVADPGNRGEAASLGLLDAAASVQVLGGVAPDGGVGGVAPPVKPSS